VEISTVFAVTVLSSMRLHKLIKRMCDWYYPDRSEYFHGTWFAHPCITKNKRYYHGFTLYVNYGWIHRSSSVTRYGLDDRGSITGKGKGRIFSHRHRVQTGSGAHPTYFPWGTGVKRPVCETDHSPSSSNGVKNAWSYTSIHPYVFIA